MNQIFTSKANTLMLLQKKAKSSKIEKIFHFKVKEWFENDEKLLGKISATFKTGSVVVRSSALDEDSLDSSEAGKYQSILDVNPNNKRKLKNGINSVIKSYYQKGNSVEENQILIQAQSQQIVISGVVFTKTPELGRPYYVINYEQGQSTTGVTQGLAGQVVKIFRNTSQKNIPEKWRSLIKSIKEIESIFSFNSLDIEFAINKKQEILIFQVRPITSIKQKFSIRNLETTISKLIFENKKQFSNLSKKKHLVGNFTFFSDMSDWNPSEIIGNNPNQLDYSLYKFLITDDIWYKSRAILGYHNVKSNHLMQKFGNKPYIDVRASFNSLIPKNLSKQIKKKLISYYFHKLEKFPHLHDKVEFDILFTCYDFTIDKRFVELKNHGFTANEIDQIKSALISHTRDILNNFSAISSECEKSLLKLLKRRDQIFSELHNSQSSYKDLLFSAEKLLIDCKNFGTLSFAIMARISFIGSILLRSLQKKGIFGNNFYGNFINSINTPLTDIQNDVSDLKNKKISKQTFFKKYGHLRPGTYDITRDRYDKNNTFFSDIDFKKKIKPKGPQFNKKIVSELLLKHLDIQSNINLFNLIRDAIMKRENLKFEFTKNLSDSLELIAEAGTIMGFTRDELSNLDINTIIKSKNFSKIKLQKTWNKKIELQKRKKRYNRFLTLPQIIFSINDFNIITNQISKPNFITNKKIIGHLLAFRKNVITSSIKNKILLIESADPGFDWIFTKNPIGLITKYGGVASHMSIRCAEIGLPAAIGCGESLFSRLLSSSKIELDCKNQQIFILEQKKEDRYIEEKKVLKSLGYIK
tara:strand:- start:2101 stop:4533 length:2433 start_codon:yes stop_codon:yes gene_type:complete